MNQNKAPAKLFFASDYMEGAHPLILQRLMETNLLHTVGYGTDEFSESARAKVRKACNAPDADVYFLVGGTQTNATVIGSILRPYQGVIAAETGHVSTHEAGAIEAGGHKVITGRRQSRAYGHARPGLYFPAHGIRHSLLAGGADEDQRNLSQARYPSLCRRRKTRLWPGVQAERCNTHRPRPSL